MIKRVCVYCASSEKVDRRYFSATATIGRILAENRITVVYGGGSVGLMGCLADAVLEHRGEVIGIIPHFMKEVEWQHNGLSDLVLVDDMHERKRRFLVDADAVIALPGGCGTLEELLEVITLKRLGIFVKPILIFNQNGYYDPLIEMLEKAIDQHFMGNLHRGIWTVFTEAELVLQAIEDAADWDESAIKFAKV